MVRKYRFLGFLFFLTLVLGGCDLNDDQSFLSEMVCEPPCWQGITPGVTTKEEALLILKGLPGIGPNSISTHGEPWWIFDDILYFEHSSRDWDGEVYILNSKVVIIDFYGDLGINFSEAIDQIGKPEFVINIPTHGGVPGHPTAVYSITAFEPNRGIGYTFNTGDLPKRNRSELSPDTPITLVSYFDPDRYDELLEGEMFSMGFLGKEETLKYLQPWSGYGSIEEKYPHAIIK